MSLGASASLRRASGRAMRGSNGEEMPRASASIDARQSMIHCIYQKDWRPHARPEPGHASWKDTP